MGVDNLGHRARDLRRTHGFSTRHMADRLGITISAVRQIESCSWLPSLPLALALARELNCSCSWLLIGVATEFDDAVYLEAIFGGERNVCRISDLTLETWGSSGHSQM